MKRMAFLIAAAATASMAWAQAQAPSKDAARAEAAKPAPTEARKDAPAAQDSAQKPAMAKKSRRTEDARHCLEKGTNTEIIKCAEAYL